MIPEIYKDARIVVFSDTKQEWYDQFLPFFDEAMKYVDEQHRPEVEQRRIYLRNDYFDITITTRVEFTAYKFRITDGVLEYFGYEGDYR